MTKTKNNKPQMLSMRAIVTSNDMQREDDMLAGQKTALYYVGEQLKLNQRGLLSKLEMNMRINFIVKSAFEIDQQGRQWTPADAGIPTM